MARSSQFKTTLKAGSIGDTHTLIPGVLWMKSISVQNRGAASFYLHVLDRATLPADGPIPLTAHKFTPVLLTPNASVNIEFRDLIPFLSGLCMYASSTEVDKTIILTDDMVGTIYFMAEA